MKRYYKPRGEDLVLNLIVELYNEDESEWSEHLITGLSSMIGIKEFLFTDNLRVKYLDEDDFTSLGFKLEAPFVGTDKIFTGETIINDKGEQEDEYETINLYDYNNLGIFKNGLRLGTFRPNDYTFNCTFRGKEYHFKNLHELTIFVEHEKIN